MAVYEFACNECGLLFEVMKSMSRSDESEKCVECGKVAQRLVSKANFGFTFPESQLRGMAPPNTGTSFDHNADRVIGLDAEKKHKLIQERQAYKRRVIQNNPGSTGHDLSRTNEGDHRVMKPEERRAAERGRAINRQVMHAIEKQKPSSK